MDRIAAGVEAVDLERLAAEVAARLAPLAPDDYTVTADGATIRILDGPYGTWHDLREDLAVHGISAGSSPTPR
jgi:hypothetical protein